MRSGYRDWSAQVFDLALRLGGLTVRQQQSELARLLNRSAPISRAALKEWRTGVVPVPMEVVKAACDLSGYGLAKIIDLVPELEEREAEQPRHGSQAGRVYLQLVPGGLGLLVAIVALLWVLASGWQPAISAFENMAHRVISGPAPFVISEAPPRPIAADADSPMAKRTALVSTPAWSRAPRARDAVSGTDAPPTSPVAAADAAPAIRCTPGAASAPATGSAPATSSSPAGGSPPAAGSGTVPSSVSGAGSPPAGGSAPGADCSAATSSVAATTAAPATSSAPAATSAPAASSPSTTSSPPETTSALGTGGAVHPKDRTLLASDASAPSSPSSAMAAQPGPPGSSGKQGLAASSGQNGAQRQDGEYGQAGQLDAGKLSKRAQRNLQAASRSVATD